MRYLITNADDFGLSTGTNCGIIEAHERGIVTSASLMVRQSGAAEAAVYARGHRALSVGLHVDLGEWVFCDEEWREAYKVVACDDAAAVGAEVARQLAAFRKLMGTDPTHLDSHQHAHRHEPVCSILRALAQELQLPLRHYAPAIFFCGDFYGQGDENAAFPDGITVENLIAILTGLPPGTSELGCHPGSDAGLKSTYREERMREVRTLCDPRVQAALGRLDITLTSFAFPGSVRPASV